MKVTIVFLPFLILLLNSCTADELPEPDPADCNGPTPTYEMDIRPIIEASCAYSGCHLGGAPGVYNSYANLLPDLESGLIAEKVIDLASDPTFGMPPNYAPEDRPRDLTPQQLILFDCWLQGGFPEN
ncbi:MAG: hypothetical protein AAFQ37_09145 [Bacteroidota bacterium]